MIRLRMARRRTGMFVAACIVAMPAAAQEVSIVGVWRAVEGTPSGMTPGITSSDVQVLTFTADGQYRRQITVEGGNGVVGAAGTIIDSGLYKFVPRPAWNIPGKAGTFAPP